MFKYSAIIDYLHVEYYQNELQERPEKYVETRIYSFNAADPKTARFLLLNKLNEFCVDL